MRRSKKREPESHQVEIADDDGKPFRGTYTLDRQVVTVHTVLHGSKATQLGAMTPEGLARILLRELLVQSTSQ